MKREYRFAAELRVAAGDEMALVGYAALFNNESKDLGGFRETIAPGAFTRSLKEGHDVKALFNHDSNHVLGRVGNGTLKLEQDEKGLRYRVDINKDDAQAVSTYAKVKRGDINECSFAFTVPKGGQVWADKQIPGTDGRGIEDYYAARTLTDVNLLDVSAVTYPAYDNTVVAARMFEDVTEVRSLVEGVQAAVAAKLAAQRAEEDESYEEAICEVSKALADKFPAEDGVSAGWNQGKYWVIETHEGYVIACEAGSDEYCKIPYVESGDDVFVFGEPQPVEKEWVPAERGTARKVTLRAAYSQHLAAIAEGHASKAKEAEATAAEHAKQAEAHVAAAAAVQQEADAMAACEASMGNHDVEQCSCQNNDVDLEDAYDENYDNESDDERMERKASAHEARVGGAGHGKVRTKRVDGKNLTAKYFAFVGDPEKTETWKLPVHDANHVRNALARFDQTDLPADKKAGAWRKIVAAANKFGIHVSAEDNSRMLVLHGDAEDVAALLRLRMIEL